VRAQVGDAFSAPLAVRGAPADCGQELLARIRAKWSCRGDLRVDGKGAPAGADVAVYDAGGTQALAGGSVDAKGRFRVSATVAIAPLAVDVHVALGSLQWVEDAVPVEVCGMDDEDSDSDSDGRKAPSGGGSSRAAAKGKEHGDRKERVERD
jgi:hypothetical protein